MDFIQSEYGSVNFGDKRLNERGKLLLKRLSNKPMDSIPGSCNGWAETKAAYRFLRNDSVTAKKIIKPHRMATFQRISQHQLVLLVQDTTVLNYSGQKKRPDIGPIQQNNVRGIFLHPMLAVSPKRECLGIVDYEQWARKRLKNQTPKERKRINLRTPLKEKESYRWLRGYKKAARLSRAIPMTKFIYIADREGDLFEVFQEAQKEFKNGKADFIIRAHYDRSLLTDDTAKSSGKLKSSVKSSAPVGQIKFVASSKATKKTREVTQTIYTKKVTLKPPAGKGKNGQNPVQTTIIIATEENPPEGEKPMEWVLLTSVPVPDLETAMKVMEWYLCRWQIEIFFKILKSGCRVERIQLHDKQTFDPCLAMYLTIAWRILFLTTMGRAAPNMNSECLFDPIEWQTAYVIIKKKPPPKTAPSLQKMLAMIAELGGFLGRKCDGDPGPIVMWKGLQSLYEYIRAREAFEIAFKRSYG
jgi:Transposase Tn5 dimerisation domain/Transposase DNA-binding